jgi:hypothetical protein
MTMMYRSHRGMESLHNGTLEHTGHSMLAKQYWIMLDPIARAIG